jgi:hypothetical protein
MNISSINATMFLLFNHHRTAKQDTDAFTTSLGMDRIVLPSPEISRCVNRRLIMTTFRERRFFISWLECGLMKKKDGLVLDSMQFLSMSNSWQGD